MEGALAPGGPRAPLPATAARRALVCALALAGSACGGAPEPPELALLVTVDTLRADHLGAYGSDRGLTPNLDRWAEESELFTAAYAPASFTLPSIAALMTGRQPEELGIWKNESGLGEGVSTLAGELSRSGWRTAAVVSNFVLRRRSGLAAGFDRYDDALPARERVRRWPERDAAATTDAALSLLEGCSAGGRCFLWVHYQDPHGPYTPSPAARERRLAAERAAADGGRQLPLLDDSSGIGGIPDYQALEGRRDVAFYRAGYAAEVAAVDAEIGRLMDGLRARGLDETALLAFAADHGESLGEDDYWFAHGEHLSDALVRVPLWIRDPARAPRRRDDVASLVDLRTTLLRRLNAGGAAPGAGRDLLAPAAPGAESRAYLATLGASRVPRYGWVEGGWKLVLEEGEGGETARLTRRGHGGGDLSQREAARAERMRERLARYRASLQGVPPRRPGVSDEEREALGALGYTAE